MATVKTYSIANDTEHGQVRGNQLHAEILSSASVTDFSGISTHGDVLDVMGAALANETALDAVVAAHCGGCLNNSCTPCVDEYRVSKIEAIDNRTDELIAEGFDFNSKHFSLSLAAQTNWLGLAVLQGALTWPVGITAGDDTTYSLALADLPAFLAAGMGVIKQSIDTGRALKEAAIAATTIEGINAVVDNR